MQLDFCTAWTNEMQTEFVGASLVPSSFYQLQIELLEFTLLQPRNDRDAPFPLVFLCKRNLDQADVFLWLTPRQALLNYAWPCISFSLEPGTCGPHAPPLPTLLLLSLFSPHPVRSFLLFLSPSLSPSCSQPQWSLCWRFEELLDKVIYK